MNNTSKRQQAMLDKATKAMLSLGALPEGFKRPDTAPREDKNRRFRMDVDRKGKRVIVEIKD